MTKLSPVSTRHLSGPKSAIVSQEPDLFNAGVRDSIAYHGLSKEGRTISTDDQIVEPGKTAHDFIADLPTATRRLLVSVAA